MLLELVELCSRLGKTPVSGAKSPAVARISPLMPIYGSLRVFIGCGGLMFVSCRH